ncbi:hypothetical protein [Mucilaginibacter sp.]|uniref:hypothetical protein n=1 Tax=Mucilaginibacter sp. TaxID=1882438 RepID=UPI003B0097D7
MQVKFKRTIGWFSITKIYNDASSKTSSEDKTNPGKIYLAASSPGVKTRYEFKHRHNASFSTIKLVVPDQFIHQKQIKFGQFSGAKRSI